MFQASILPAAIWESIDVATDDLDLPVFHLRGPPDRDAIAGFGGRERRAAGSDTVEELEGELIQIETEFRKG